MKVIRNEKSYQKLITRQGQIKTNDIRCQNVHLK